MKVRVAFVASVGISLLSGVSSVSAVETAQPAKGFRAGQVFKDCADCPEVVVIPPGTSLMGSTPEEDVKEMVPAKFSVSEKPPHAINILKPFALGKSEVTRAQFATYLKESGATVSAGDCMAWDKQTQKWGRSPDNTWQNPGFAQTENDPVVCVSWNDAKGYADWLSKKTGKNYRLATEAEWEYAARAGTTTVRDWGDDRDISCTKGNMYDMEAAKLMGTKPGPNENFLCNDPYLFTAPIASFPPNKFGVYDMLGNAWEWTADCWHENYQGAPTDGSAWTTGDCSKRVGRSGSWGAEPWALRIAHRRGNDATFKFSSLGFRIARDLN
jgi:formylglycine-generating enzyme required for sulfatase activity